MKSQSQISPIQRTASFSAIGSVLHNLINLAQPQIAQLAPTERESLREMVAEAIECTNTTQSAYCSLASEIEATQPKEHILKGVSEHMLFTTANTVEITRELIQLI
ncbi:hypothetical protein [Neisseria shayeganii]|uniref:Uncharacterized protein n=1 Tax=Neisseria shayeganii TaxID=607712 RepID=A0A7D7N2H5_9NEIS|nr:hypothetical protein [Neisseria shayeganii]QMT39825.1 hypothetical protein H3L94_08080 [Neisseria shayeganii]